MSNKNKSKENYIIIPNDVFNNSARRLTVEELYLYSCLYRDRIPDEWTTKTSIDILSHGEYKYSKGNSSRNKQSIKEILISLVDNRYINTIGEFEINSKTKNSDMLLIEFPFIETGYNENITYKIFDQFDDPLEFYIYAYIDCFGTEGRTISYHMWSKVVRRSETTVKEVLNKMNTYDFKPRIWKFSGDYYKTVDGSARQEMNTYYTRPDEDTIKKWNGFYAEGRSEVKELAFGHRGGRSRTSSKDGSGGKGGDWESIEDMF